MIPRPIIVGPVHWGPSRITATMLTSHGPQRVFFDGVDCPEAAAADPFMVVAGGAGLHQQKDVVMTSACGLEAMERMLDRQHRLLRILGDQYAQQTITTRHRKPLGTPPPGRGVAAMFTAGLDSMHMVLRNLGEIEALVFVHGFDTPLHNWRHQAATNHRIRSAAKDIGRPLMEITTDLREWSDTRADWALYVHAGIDAVGMAISNRFRELWFAASVVERHLPIAGTEARHAGHEWVDVIRKDAHLTRPEKVEAIADHPAFRRYLRVCWQNTGEYNCGRCEKCVRTMINLASVGALGAVDTLPAALPARAVEDQPVASNSDRAFLVDNLDAAERTGQTGLARALADRLAEAPGG